jgi:hypothetical protein
VPQNVTILTTIAIVIFVKTPIDAKPTQIAYAIRPHVVEATL